MNEKRLQIKQLSKSGELLRCINCFGGQVSVFRAVGGTSLQPYQRALAGIPGPERFTVTLDGDSYSPEQANLIGFGESMFNDPETVEQYLEASGLPSGSVRASLLSYGLDDVAEKPCNTLSKDEQRRLAIIAATFDVNKMLILNNPFEEISSQWRERFAELILNFARTNNQIVVIPSLIYRPESWISNECVARVQVGENLQRTIGFGSDASQMNDMVKQVRAMFNSEEEARKAVESVAPNAAKKASSAAPADKANDKAPEPQPAKQKVALSVGVEYDRNTRRSTAIERSVSALKYPFSRSPIISYVSLVALVLVVGVLIYDGVSKPDNIKTASKQNTTQNKPVQAKGSTAVNKKEGGSALTKSPRTAINNPFAAAVNSNKDPGSVFKEMIEKQKAAQQQGKKEAPAAIPKIDRPVTSNQKQYVLNRYPTEIRKAIMDTFNGNFFEKRDVGVTASGLGGDDGGKKTADDHSPNLFSMLESTSGSGENIKSAPSRPSAKRPSYSPPSSISSMSSEDIEERRERIRQKFLDAIRRASENR